MTGPRYELSTVLRGSFLKRSTQWPIFQLVLVRYETAELSSRSRNSNSFFHGRRLGFNNDLAEDLPIFQCTEGLLGFGQGIDLVDWR
jgi:hypothetical protein